MSKLEMSIKTIDAKSMLIGFLLCAVGFLTMGASELDNGILNIDGNLYVKGLVVTNDPYNWENAHVTITPYGVSATSGEDESNLTSMKLTLSYKDKD